MWQLLCESLNGIEVIDLLNTPQVKAKRILEQIDSCNHNLKNTFTNSITPQVLNEESEVKLIYAIVEEEKLIAVLYGDNILNLEMQPLYTELIQKTVPITSMDDVYCATVNRIINRIVKEKNSIISPKEFQLLKKFTTTVDDTKFIKNLYCIDSSDILEIKLHQLCTTRYFKKIKNEYSRKWNSIIAMKDFRVTKLYYKKHLLVGFSLYRLEDGEQFFMSGQFQEVLESLIFNKKVLGQLFCQLTLGFIASC